jgi:hypothetical protein
MLAFLDVTKPNDVAELLNHPQLTRSRQAVGSDPAKYLISLVLAAITDDTRLEKPHNPAT